MDILYALPTAILSLAAISIVAAYACFRRVFYSRPRRTLGEDEFDVPTGNRYDPYRQQMIEWVKTKRALPCRPLSVTSFDGLTLRGQLYTLSEDAPIEILFNGYRGNAERDLSGAIERCFSVGRSALLVDQRASGASDGSVISFGINECRDCLRWIDRVIEVFGEDTEIVIGGVSMGAATVIMASAEKLPPNVKYAVADCSFTSPEEIIKKSIGEMKLPIAVVYPLIRLGARLFGHFSISENSPIEAVRKSRIPIIFLHGDDDDFVPCHMSERLYEECVSPKKLSVIKGAAHGLAFPADRAGYVAEIKEFEKQISVFNK